jgi:hypothetical protein
MYFFSCNVCACRGAMCWGSFAPQLDIKCPKCSEPLASLKRRRTLIDKIRDAWTPSELVEATNNNF